MLITTGNINLIPSQTVMRGGGMRVVIFVPALSERKQGNPPIVPAVIACGEAARTPHVSGGVHQPRGMQTKHNYARV